MAINPKRFAVWGLLSLLLLLGVGVLFATFGVRPASLGGSGEAGAYDCFLSILYIVDVLCLCLIGGMKRQPGFPAAFAVYSGLALAWPEQWGASFYGIVLKTGGGSGFLRIFAGGLLLLGAAAFAGGLYLHTKGWGQPVRPMQVPSLLDLDEDDDESEDE